MTTIDYYVPIDVSGFLDDPKMVRYYPVSKTFQTEQQLSSSEWKKLHYEVIKINKEFTESTNVETRIDGTFRGFCTGLLIAAAVAFLALLN